MMKNILLTAALVSAPVYAERMVQFQWDQVDDDRVQHYELAWGSFTDDYAAGSTETSNLTAAATFDTPGVMYVAVRACGEHLCSDWSEELIVFWPNKPTGFMFVP